MAILHPLSSILDYQQLSDLYFTVLANDYIVVDDYCHPRTVPSNLSVLNTRCRIVGKGVTIRSGADPEMH